MKYAASKVLAGKENAYCGVDVGDKMLSLVVLGSISRIRDRRKPWGGMIAVHNR